MPFRHINSFFISSNRILFVSSVIFFGVIINILLSFIYYDILALDLGASSELLVDIPTDFQFMIIVFVAPITETAIFQYLLIVLALKTFMDIHWISHYTIKHYFKVVLISSILFSLIHSYSIVYCLLSFIMSLYFGYITIISEFIRKKKVSVFISVGLLHVILNLMTYI